MKEAKQLPAGEREDRLAVLEEVKELMSHTKEHVTQATEAGKMDGQPFLHVMFGNIEIETTQ